MTNVAENAGVAATQARQSTAPGAWYVVGLCMVAYILSFVDRQILALLIEPIRADLGISDTQFGLLHGLAFSIFYATMGIPIATLTDRVSRPWIIAVGVFFWSAATMACGAARSFVQLFLARICVGAGEAALSPATYSLIGDLFPRGKLGRAIAVYSLGSFLGTGLAFLVGGALIAAMTAAGDWQLLGVTFRPWQMTFILVGLPGLLLALVIQVTVREPRLMGARAQTEPAPSFTSVLAFLRDQRRIFLPHMVGYTLAAMTLFTLLGWSPAYLIRGFGLSPRECGLWLGPIAILAGGGGVLASGWLMDWLGQRGHADAPFRTGIIGAAGAAVPVALLPLAGTLTVALVLLTVTYFFASFPMPPSTAVMQVVPPPRIRARVAALFLCCNSLGGLALGSALVGLLNDHVFGNPKMVGTSSAIVAGGAAVLSAIVLSFGRAPYRAATSGR
ncbi:MFS transporter [Azospirillum sp. B4]|uniref:spinster family MFS transporter n=1 Tax=Azospirillum sp. B4 TaxID=95605 RepID=UPI00034D02E6|nr:MFS transporter [Azospirillum sp. B4]